MTAKLTADTITDDQIERLQEGAAEAGDMQMVDICRDALRACAPDDVSSWVRDARWMCAKAINAAAAMAD